MRPSWRFVQCVSVWFILAIVAGTVAQYIDNEKSHLIIFSWWVLGGIFFLISILDYFLSLRADHLHIERNLPAGLAVGTDNTVVISITNRASYALFFKITEQVDSSVRVDGMPLYLQLKPKESSVIKINIRPTHRGPILFNGIDTLIETQWRFWALRTQYLEPTEIKVYPNFTAVSNFELLAHGQISGQMGVHLKQRRGEGTDFHQLREFRPGDALRQVDWKATSRALKPISREFQDERDQDIIFLLDNGSKMRPKDGELSYFDHCLNAFLLTSYVALKQGDAVGFRVFGGTDKWVSPIKGKNNLNTLMHQVYDLHSSAETTDYVDAAQKLISNHSKRSLIVLISNVSAHDNDELMTAYSLLRKRHLVILACLQESSVFDVIEKPVTDFMDALAYSGAVAHHQKRHATLKYLLGAGAIILDSLPSQMHIALVNEYLALKRSGRI